VVAQRQLAHPPIREALIDIRVADPLPLSFAELLQQQTLTGYERKQPIRLGQLRVELGPELQTEGTQELFGWRFETPDGSKVVQLRRNGVGISVIKSYRDWQQIKAIAVEVWDRYAQWADHPYLDRLATRYINVLELPLVNVDLDHYLAGAPRIPEGLPQTMNNFLQRVSIPFDASVIAIVTQALEAPTQTHLPVVLDIDVQAHIAQPLPGDSGEIWTILDRLRKIKNDVFFSWVTERALEPYK
jgi:uncharacterized protein (TIGR04255 family)